MERCNGSLFHIEIHTSTFQMIHGTIASTSRLICIIVSILAYTSTSFHGVDLSVRTDVTSWTSMISGNNKYLFNITFASIRVFEYSGVVDINAVSTISAAWDAGLRNISVYAFPCVPNFARSSSSSCASASSQVKTIVNTLASSGISFRSNVTGTHTPTMSPTTTANVTESFVNLDGSVLFDESIRYSDRSLSAVTSNNITIEYLFINVEDDIPARYFHQDPWSNLNFLKEFVNEAWSQNIAVGIYTTYHDWLRIMVPKNQSIEDNIFSDLPLWTPRYDGASSMDYFVAFAGWSTAFMKQLDCGSTASRRLGNNRICYDFISE